MTLPQKERIKLVGGPYRTPVCRIGGFLECERYGMIKVKTLTHAPIPWPMGIPVGVRSPQWTMARCGDLIQAVKVESIAAIMYWFGLGGTAVSRLRKEYHVPRDNAGTLRLRKSQRLTEEHKSKLLKAGWLARQEIAAPTRWKMEEDRIVWHLSSQEAAMRLIGRTIQQIGDRRRTLRGTMVKHGKQVLPPPWLEEIKREPPPASFPK